MSKQADEEASEAVRANKWAVRAVKQLISRIWYEHFDFDRYSVMSEDFEKPGFCTPGTKHANFRIILGNACLFFQFWSSLDTYKHESNEKRKKLKKKIFHHFSAGGGGEPHPFGGGFLETEIEIQKSPR